MGNKRMLSIEELPIEGYEKVVEVKDPEVGLHSFIAIHSTSLGPAMGGTRIFPYKNAEEALNDVLRLAKGMTYKSAVVENGLGGGKSVIIADPKRDKTPELLKAFAEGINFFKGSYITAEDVGSTTEDMTIIRQKSPYVAALPTIKSSGDPSRFTAWGVYQGLRAVAQHLWGNPSLRGKVIAIQGVGNVGSKLARFLFWEGVELIMADVDSENLEAVCHKYGAKVVPPNEIHAVSCDIFAPCAMGGIINKQSIPQLKCKAIAGSANNQLLEPEDAIRLNERDILYAPDFIINSGGIINASAEFDPGGYNPKTARDKVNHIYFSLLNVLERAKKEHESTLEIAEELAEYNLTHLVGKRKQPIYF